MEQHEAEKEINWIRRDAQRELDQVADSEKERALVEARRVREESRVQRELARGQRERAQALISGYRVAAAARRRRVGRILACVDRDGVRCAFSLE